MPMLLLIVYYFLACDNDNSNINIPEHPDKIVVRVMSISCKQYYKTGEKFSTRDSVLYVEFSDGTKDWISSGYTHEWSEDIKSEYYEPIKHGDTLPVNPVYKWPVDFYIRGDYNGLKGNSLTCTV